MCVGSTKGSRTLAHRVMEVCRVHPGEEVFEKIDETAASLERGDVDIAFITAGVPLKELDPLLGKELEDLEVGLMSMDPDVIAEMNQIYACCSPPRSHRSGRATRRSATSGT